MGDLIQYYEISGIILIVIEIIKILVKKNYYTADRYVGIL